ncbi:MAG TPA: hypothetical protein VFU53_05235 [Burkholderiales bacterium]|nr:hypothetical protein [Burkholderiales bacterium]
MQSRTPWRWLALWLVLLGLASPLATMPAAAQHQHDAGAHALKLDNGKRWETDAPLRQGMTAIRDALSAHHPAIHANQETAGRYKSLAGTIDGQIAYIVQNCKLAPEADGQLHIILADIIAGADLMKGADRAKRREGAVMIVDAFEKYPQYFEHPGWRAIE